MQKVLNVLTVISFGAVTIATAAGVYVYTNKDAIIDNVKAEVMGSVAEMLPVPEIPGLGGGLGADVPSADAGGIPALPVPSLPF